MTKKGVGWPKAELCCEHALNLGEFVLRQRKIFQRRHVLLDLADFARADEGAGDRGMAEHPHERELRERLAAGFGVRVELPELCEFLLGDVLRFQETRIA